MPKAIFHYVDIKVAKMAKSRGKVSKVDMLMKGLILAGLVEGGQDGQDVLIINDQRSVASLIDLC